MKQQEEATAHAEGKEAIEQQKKRASDAVPFIKH